MPFSPAENAARRDNRIASDISVRLHTGDPGNAGTANEIPAGSVGTRRPTISGGDTGWDKAGGTDATPTATATPKTDPDFGNATQAINGVSWVSYFRGAAYVGKRQLAAPQDVANGAPVSLAASTMTWSFASTDA